MVVEKTFNLLLVEPKPLHTPTEDSPPSFAVAYSWLTEFLTSEQPELMRSGAVCPCLSSALKSSLVYFITIQLPETELYEKKKFAHCYIKDAAAWLISKTKTNPKSDKICLLIVVEGLQEVETRQFMNGIYNACRGNLLAKSIMFGSFHKYNTRHSRLNKHYYSMRTSVPLFAMRMCSPLDERNLKNEPFYYSIYKLRALP